LVVFSVFSNTSPTAKERNESCVPVNSTITDTFIHYHTELKSKRWFTRSLSHRKT
jgi:hypothetical protein